MNLERLLVAVVGGAALWQWASKCQQSRQPLAQARTHTAELRTWESEGGAPRDRVRTP